MLQALLDWLTGLPGVALHGALALVAAIENVFPPFPADTVVAFGGYLAARADRSLLATFAAVWIGNLGGAMLMYALGRRYGAERLFHHMGGGDPARARERVRALYGRYGTLALFISRFLPGVRGFVPPLAGAAHIPAPRTALVFASASAVWYGMICWLAYRLSGSFEAILGAIASSGRWIGIVAMALIAAAAAVWYLRRRRRA